MPSSNLLPPLPAPGQQPLAQNDGEIIGYLTRLAEESRRDRAPWEQVADVNYTIFVYGAFPIPESTDIVVNEIQTHIISSQLQEPPTATLKPVETGEISDVYWAGDQQTGLSLGLLPEETGSFLADPANPTSEQPPQPIRQPVAKALLDMVENGQLEDDQVVEVNDRLVAEVEQTVFDLLWNRSDANRIVASAMLRNDVVGWHFLLYEFDDDAKKHCLRHLPVKQVYMDPTVEDIADAAYAGFDLPIDADEARRLYPHLMDAINREASPGVPTPPDGNSNFGQAFDREFLRPIVTLRCFWIRNQEMPLSVEAALALGKVEMREVQDESGTPTDQTLENALGAGDGVVAPGNAGGREGLPAGDGESAGEESASRDNDEPVGDDDGTSAEGAGSTGSPVSENATGEVSPTDGGEGTSTSPPMAPSAPLATRAAYFLPGSQVEIFPPDSDQAMPEDAPPWPFRLVIRQITTIAGEVVDDRECEHWDIPLVQNVNIPIPGKPYGLGEPFRLAPMQKARSRALKAIDGHVQQFKGHLICLPRSVQQSLPDSQKQGMIKPATRFVVDDEIFKMMNGKMFSIQDPPQTPPALISSQAIFKEEMVQMTGRTDVMRGQETPDAKSGRAILALQQAAVSVIDFKHRRGGEMVVRLAKLMLHSIVQRLTCADVMKIVSKYAYPVLEAICQRAKRFDWDIEVEQVSGTAQMKAAKAADALAKYQAGVISYRTYCEEAGIDYHQEMRRKRAEMKIAAGLAAQTPQVQQPAQGQPPANGNGANGKQQTQPQPGNRRMQ